jgi:superfamily I DNA/RNA helicase
MEFISEQQRIIVESEAQYKLISGCAGSHKTSTLIKCALHEIARGKKSVLFLTLVSSVTCEIKQRLEVSLGVTFSRLLGNHYVGVVTNTSMGTDVSTVSPNICVSNYDSWVHHMLTENNVDITDIEDYYEKKTQLLCDLTSLGPIKILSKSHISEVDLLIIDEFQDLQDTKVETIINFGRSNKNLSIYVAGDYLQTLYNADRIGDGKHAMKLFETLSPTMFNLNICKRCPKAHVTFANFIMSPARRLYNIPPMLADNENMIDKPVLFTHNALTSIPPNTNARINAEQITRMLDALLQYDKSIVPDDIAIIMKTTKKSETFYQLQNTLNELYNKHFGVITRTSHIIDHTDSTELYIDSGRTYYMNTYGDGYHNTLNWDKAEGKTKLVSIHGDKGKGHKVVIFLGLTDKSIPDETTVNTEAELISQSLLNVAITRSTKYLFIGFTRGMPSRYLSSIRDKLANFTYIAWSRHSKQSDFHNYLKSLPFPYGHILAISHSNVPSWTFHGDRINCGIKSNVSARDLSKDLDYITMISDSPAPTRKNAASCIFGSSQMLRGFDQIEQYMLMGTMAELLIRRKLNRGRLSQQLRCSSVEFTTNERLLCAVYDTNMCKTIHDIEMLFMYNKKSQETKSEVIRLFLGNIKLAHQYFANGNFRELLDEYLSDTPNELLSTRCIWNVTLYYNQITCHIYQPFINALVDTLSDELTELHHNISKVASLLNGNNLLFEQQYTVAEYCDDKELKAIGKRAHRVSITGRYDIFDSTNRILYEIKTSTLAECSNEWIIQILVYYALMRHFGVVVEQLTIVNVLSGVMWYWYTADFKPVTLEYIVTNCIANTYGWFDTEINAMMRVMARTKCVMGDYNLIQD